MSKDNAYLLDMLVAARRVISVVKGSRPQEFADDWKLQSIVQHQLMILGEAVKRLSPAFRDAHPHIRWKAIAGQRDILIHRYDDVDAEALWKIVETDLPALVRFLESVAPEPES